jgi:flagellar protein FliS
MATTNPSKHLEAKIKTASSAQLHLMLIEGALRFTMKAQQDLEKNNEGHANEAIVRAIDIVGELLAGVKGGETEINAKLADLYLYLFHTLTSAYVNTDATKLADVVRVLEFERETWRLACERVHAPQSTAVPSPVIAQHVTMPAPAQGFSFEA